MALAVRRRLLRLLLIPFDKKLSFNAHVDSHFMMRLDGPKQGLGTSCEIGEAFQSRMKCSSESASFSTADFQASMASSVIRSPQVLTASIASSFSVAKNARLMAQARRFDHFARELPSLTL